MAHSALIYFFASCLAVSAFMGGPAKADTFPKCERIDGQSVRYTGKEISRIVQGASTIAIVRINAFEPSQDYGPVLGTYELQYVELLKGSEGPREIFGLHPRSNDRYSDDEILARHGRFFPYFRPISHSVVSVEGTCRLLFKGNFDTGHLLFFDGDTLIGFEQIPDEGSSALLMGVELSIEPNPRDTSPH